MISESVCPLNFQYLKQYARGAPFNDQLLSYIPGVVFTTFNALPN
jgi:hypothetical protein